MPSKKKVKFKPQGGFLKINKPFTDEDMIKAIVDQLKIVTERYALTYNSPEEMLGVMSEEQHELLHAIHEGRGQVTTSVLSELVDIAVVCVRGARGYIHGQAAKKGASDAMYEAWADWHKDIDADAMPQSPNPSFSHGFLAGIKHSRS
jgi:FixJ family two-component response regulator